MKGDISLNDLSKVFSPNLGEIMIGSEEILNHISLLNNLDCLCMLVL